MSDEDLLAQFRKDGAQGAFATLVERHLNLVYSVARRHVRSPDLAKDVAQSVFIDLARTAGRIKSGTPIIAWLHVVSRRTAIDAARREVRRQAREQQAAETANMKATPDAWQDIAPLLDEAVESLPQNDRSAILLRFFENRSLRDVGLALNASEDAAQKRVSRALDQLRDFFVRRGITVTATGLASDLSAHALHVAPAGLGFAISIASVPAAATAGHLMAMSVMQKVAAGTVVAALAGAGLYQTVVVARQSTKLTVLAQRSAEADRDIRAAQQARNEAATRLKGIEELIDAQLRRRPADIAIERAIGPWLENIDQMRSYLSQHPELNIPELQLLPQSAWINVASGQLNGATAPFSATEEYLRRATSSLRHAAQNALAPKMLQALAAYKRSHGDAFPEDPRQLAPYFSPAIDPAILERYEVRERVTGLQSGSMVISDRRPADLELDAAWWIGTNGFGNAGSAIAEAVNEAQRAFAKANGGRRAATPEEIRPFLRWPVSDELLQKHLPAPR